VCVRPLARPRAGHEAGLSRGDGRLRRVRQVHADIKVADVIKNDYVASANDFDKAKVKADAESYKLADDYASIDAEAIRKAL
jgi:NitT/TauT family transport system substrate-binding protein